MQNKISISWINESWENALAKIAFNRFKRKNCKFYEYPIPTHNHLLNEICFINYRVELFLNTKFDLLLITFLTDILRDKSIFYEWIQKKVKVRIHY